MSRRPRARRGGFAFEPELYGRSAQGRPLEVWLPDGDAELLVFAGLHGEEPETTVALSSALRSIERSALRSAVVLAANPDGLARGTRGNVRGVELNRNFPAADWVAQAPVHKWTRTDPQDVALSAGPEPASEPETRALMELAQRLAPAGAIALHAPLACVIDAHESDLARWLAHASGLSLRRAVSSPTPGTFESWFRETVGRASVTFELPVISKNQALVQYLELVVELITASAGELRRSADQ